MKRISTILLFLLLATTLKAQNLVSTDPYKRNVIIEEYTGVYCGYCPDGHRIANELAAKYQDRLFVLNIHTGGYANDASIDFRTEDGNIIGAKVNSFPTGNVNRLANNLINTDNQKVMVVVNSNEKAKKLNLERFNEMDIVGHQARNVATGRVVNLKESHKFEGKTVTILEIR